MSDEASPMTLDSDGGEEQQPNGSDEDDKTTKDPDILKKKAIRMLKIFRQIAECLEKVVVVEIKEMLSNVMSISRTADVNEKEEKFTQVYLRFLDKVEFRAGISVNLIAQAIRCFMMIEEDTEGLGKTVSEMYLEMIVTDHPSLAIDMNLDDELLKVYFKLLDEGYEEMQHIRLMVVGMYGVGKTTLVRRLCRSTDTVESTVGIDIFQHLCEINEDLDWEKSDSKRIESYLNLRLQELMAKYRKEDQKIPHDIPSVTPLPVQKPITTPSKPMNFEKFRDKVVTKQHQSSGYKIDELKEIDQKKEKQPKRRPTVSIWDFAGQSVYYSTHHFFLNARSVYILVLDLSKDLHEEVEENNCLDVHQNLNLGSITKGYTCLDAFKFWMKSIYIYTKQRKDNQENKYKPKIILVGTFKDAISAEKLKGIDANKYKDDYFWDALKPFYKTPIMDIVHREFFLISNKDDSDEKDLLSIKRLIFNISSNTKQLWNEKVPAKFIPLERAVFQHKQERKKTMKFSELTEVRNNVEYPFTDEKEIKLFLHFQHAFGNVLYYDMGTYTDQNDRSNHSELIILTPQWIIDAFKAFVTHTDKAKDLERRDKWELFVKEGQLSTCIVEVLLSNFSDEDKGTILTYMEYLEVIAKPVVRTEQDQDSGTPSAKSEAEPYFGTLETPTKKEDFYVMPCMLPPRPEMDKLKKWYAEPDKDTHHTTLCMYIKEGFLPAFVLHRILATAIKELPIAEFIGTKLLFNGLGSFAFSEKRMLTIWSIDNIIHLRVTFRGAFEDEKEKIEFCKALRMRFENLVLEVFNFHGKDTYTGANQEELFSLHVKCPGCKEQVPFDVTKDLFEKPVDYMRCIHSVENLLYVKEKSCGLCKERITAGGTLKYWFDIDQQPDDTHKFTEQQNETLQMEVGCCQLIDIAEKIKETDLPKLLRELNIDDTWLQTIKSDPPSSLMVFKTLHHWQAWGESWKMLYDSMYRAELDLSDFFTIIQGECGEKNEKRISNYMKDICKSEEDTLVLNDHQIADLSTCFGLHYWSFGLRLGLEHTCLVDIAYSNRHANIPNQVKEILLKWKKKSNSPVRQFIRAIVLSNCDWRRIKKILL